MKIEKENFKPAPAAATDAQAQPPVRVVVVEDETWMRESLARSINRSPKLCCVKCYRSGEEALKTIVADRPEVILMDISLPGIDGVECLRSIKTVLPEVRCLMLTVYEESDRIFMSLLAGADGYLLKRTSTREILEAILQVRGGGAPMSSSIARKVVDYFNHIGKGQSNQLELSLREKQVLELLARALTYKDIAEQLSLSIDTVRMYIKHIYAKLHIHSRSEAIAKYMQQATLPTSNDRLNR